MNTQVTRPGHLVPGWPKGVEAWAELPDVEEARAVIAEARMWRVAVWAERIAWAGFASSLILWAWLTFA
jgi:hypothetical protein